MTNKSFDMKFKIPTQPKEGHDEKLILVAVRSKDADDVKMLARGRGFQTYLSTRISTQSSKLIGDLTIPRKINHEVNKICSGASSATKIRDNYLAVSSKPILSLLSTKFFFDSLLQRSSCKCARIGTNGKIRNINACLRKNLNNSFHKLSSFPSNEDGLRFFFSFCSHLP
jgi:hypothetical protein